MVKLSYLQRPDDMSTELNTSDVTISALENDTFTSNSSKTENLFGPTFVAANYVLLTVSVVIIVSDVIAARILSQCKRIPRHCKQLSVSFVLSDAVGSAVFLLHQIVIFVFDGFGIDYEILNTSRIGSVAIFHMTASASVALLTLERVFALKANLKYSLLLTKINIDLLITLLWLIHILLPVIYVTVSYFTKCYGNVRHCNVWKVTLNLRYISAGIHITYNIILIIGNLIIQRIAKRHINGIKAINSVSNATESNITTRQRASLRSIAKIVTAYLILQAPLFICFFLGSNLEHLRDKMLMQAFRCFGYMCIQMDSFINIYIYIVTFQECKLQLLLFLAKKFKSFERKAELFRVDVYNIVILEKNSN